MNFGGAIKPTAAELDALCLKVDAEPSYPVTKLVLRMLELAP